MYKVSILMGGFEVDSFIFNGETLAEDFASTMQDQGYKVRISFED